MAAFFERCQEEKDYWDQISQGVQVAGCQRERTIATIFRCVVATHLGTMSLQAGSSAFMNATRGRYMHLG
jgi:hypothetical protein